MKLDIEKKTLASYFIVFGAVILMCFLFYKKIQNSIASSDLLMHSQEVIHRSDNVLLDILNMESGLRGYLLTNNKLFLEQLHNTETTIIADLEKLKTLTKGNSNQQLGIISLSKAVGERLDYTNEIIEYIGESTIRKESILVMLYSGEIRTEKLRSTITSISSEEFNLIKQIESEESNGNIINLLLIALAIFICALLSIYILNRQARLATAGVENQSSQYARRLIEASLDPLVTISIDGKITDVNVASIKVTGMSREQLTGTDFFDYFTETQKAREVYQEVFAKGFVIDSPLTLRHKDGKLTDVLFNGSVYKDDLGNVLGVVVVARDITEQKRSKNELIEAKSNAERATEKAEESNRLKEAFLANMSHEIRTPMNAIIGFSDILSKRNLGEQERDYALIIKTAGENLLTIINDILDISKIEAGMMTFEDHMFSVREIFTSLHVMLMERAEEKDLELVFNCDESVPGVLIGDNIRLTQIIINLVGNAIKFTEKGKVEVNVKVLKVENENTVLEFSIKDTGIGIPEDKLDHIFERFRQAETYTTRKYGGTGLGLSIAKQLAELQGGILSVESIFGVGSIFSFCIPYKKSNEILETPPISKTNDNMKELNDLKVLLIEDNKLNVKLILSLFSTYGLSVEVAGNGSEGIEKLKASNFDIILMDMEMPVMNGYEAATIIRKELKDTIPIIAMTAHAMEGEREKCLSLGMDDYITKPIHANMLFEKMSNLIIEGKGKIKNEYEQKLQKVCDLQYITEMMGGKKKLVKEMMDEFLTQIPEELSFINAAVTNRDYAIIKSMAHTMKSSVSVMSISTLTSILNEMEDLGASAGDIEKIEQLNHELDSICKKAMVEIEDEKVNYL